MGIPIEDPVFAGNCPACFPPGETPRYLYASIVSVAQGNNWGPADPPPPNGIVQLDNGGFACNWAYHDPNFVFTYNVGPPINGFSIHFVDDVDPFFFPPAHPICHWSFENTVINPVGQHYYGGGALIAFVPIGSSPSYQQLAELLGIPITDRLNGDHWPANGDGIFRYVDKVENTNILIKRDFS